MSIKPATDEEIAQKRSWFEESDHTTHDEVSAEFCADIFGQRLIARIEADREEIASLHARNSDLMALMRVQEAESGAEIARLKAEVERLTPKCPVCLGYRTTTPSGNTPCHSCHGTGRTR